MTDQTNRFDADDPRWTAYALGEIDDPAERAAIEAELAGSEEAQAFVAEVRETAELLTAELSGAAPQLELSDIQRQKIKNAASQPSAPAAAQPSRKGLWLAGGAAVAAAAGVIVMMSVGSQTDRAANQAAKRPTSTTDSSGRMSGNVQTEMRPDMPVEGQTDEEGEKRDFQSGLGSEQGVALSTPTGGVAITGRMQPRANRDPSTASPGDGYYKNDKSGKDGKKGGLYAFDSNNRNESFNREAYSHTRDNPFTDVAKDPRSTFSIDVDTGAYSNVRRMLTARRLPPADSVRIEEMINYFDYEYPQPATEHPFSLSAEIGKAPWNRNNLLVKVGVQGKELTQRARPRANLVFLIDASGSMSNRNKLPLLKRGIGMMVQALDPEDRVAVVVYAGAAGLVLPSTPVSKRSKIMRALDRLSAGGSTNGGAGIELAYKIAAKNFVQGGINRVLLATDGDFNVGVSHTGGLVRLVQDKAKSGVFLTVLGFGMGNYNDAMLEEISNKGNGHYAYIDTINEARKVLVHELDSTLMTIAKDVKIQIEFNPKQVASYRLIGYANRILAHRDFDDDKKDAGEIGAGHSVTALYEIVPAKGGATSGGGLKYQSGTTLTAAADANELMNLKLRYKKPDGDTSKLVEVGIPAKVSETPSGDFKLAAGVAAFGMLLRKSEHRGDASYAQVLQLVEGGIGRDLFGYRRELVNLVRTARSIDKRKK